MELYTTSAIGGLSDGFNASKRPPSAGIRPTASIAERARDLERPAPPRIISGVISGRAAQAGVSDDHAGRDTLASVS